MRKVFKCKTCGDINKITYISFASFGESQVAATKKLIGVTPKTMGKSSSVDRAGTLDQKSSAIFSGETAGGTCKYSNRFCEMTYVRNKANALTVVGSFTDKDWNCVSCMYGIPTKPRYSFICPSLRVYISAQGVNCMCVVSSDSFVFPYFQL